ncbi:MAG: TonB-dependent hemoglobin/transferrin/lactoferrin family receptor [Alphaproteobacteria bacterium]|nr:TonB-dependent hemoglobin/transferrin/lactoferrin family receptor [Alphaproteobacteria bacterium]
MAFYGKFWSATVAAVLVGGLAQAQNTKPESLASNQSTDKILEAISVTATRNPIKSFEYPGMVTVVGRAEIQSRQASTPADLLNFVPNVEFSGGPRRTGETPSIRGFDGADVIIMLDGARQNYGSAHDGRFFVDPALLKRVEVLRGTASSLYGSGGTGGVIEFRTVDAEDLLEPGETAGVSTSVGYQTVNREPTATLRAFGRPAEGLDFVGSITKRISGSIELGDGEKLDQTDDDIISGLAKASYSFADFHRIEGAFVSFRNKAEEPNVGQGAGGSDIVQKDIRSDTSRLSYSYENPMNNWLDLDLTAYYTETQADELRLDGNGAGPQGQLLKRDVDTLGGRLDNRSRLVFSDDIAMTLTYGGEYYQDSQDGAADAAERDGVPDAEASFYGVFAQSEITLANPFGDGTGEFLFIPGIRYDNYETTSTLASDNKSDQVSPRLGLTYMPTDWLMVFSNYGSAFRAPTFDELFLTGVHFQIPVGAGVTNRFVTNPNLKPQRTRTVEVGGGLSFDNVMRRNDHFEVKSSYFRIKGEDFIDLSVNQPALFVACNPFIPGNCDGTTTSDNVANAKLWGVEIELSYESDRLLFAFGFSKLDGVNEATGAKLGVLTPNEYTFNTGVKLPEIDAIVGWRMLLADKFDNVNSAADARDGFAVHDLYFTWEPKDKDWRGFRLDVGLDNIFDKSYSRVFTDANEAGRNFKTLVSYSYKW